MKHLNKNKIWIALMLLFNTVVLAQECDFTNLVTLGPTVGRRTGADWNTVYYLVDNNTGLVIQKSTSGGDFTAVPTGLYQIYAINYQISNPPSPHPLTGVNVGSALTASTCTGGCFDVLQYTGKQGTGQPVKICNSEVCEGQVLEVGGSGYRDDANFDQTYILVDPATNLIVANSPTGNFGVAPATWNGYKVYMVNYKVVAPNNVTTQLNVGQAYPTAINAAGCCYEAHATGEDVIVRGLPTVAGTGGNVCQNTNVSINLTGTNSNAYDWNLAPPGGYTGTPTSGSITPSGTGTGTITSGPSNVASGTFTFTVTPKFTNSIVSCIGDLVTITSTARPQPILSATSPTVACGTGAVSLSTASLCATCQYTVTSCTGCDTPAPIGPQSSTAFDLSGATAATVTATSSFGCVSAPLSYNFLDSPFNCPTPLPVELISFTGNKQGKTNVVKWQTSRELNIATFEIERSTDGVTFLLKGNKTPKGTASTGSSYDLVDDKPNMGNNYYRLKITDNDGTVRYSNVINLPFESKVAVISTIYPNPTKGDLNVSVFSPKDEDVTVLIHNTDGKVLFQQYIAVQAGVQKQIVVDASLFDKGLYTISLVDNAGLPVSTVKFAKE